MCEGLPAAAATISRACCARSATDGAPSRACPVWCEHCTLGDGPLKCPRYLLPEEGPDDVAEAEHQKREPPEPEPVEERASRRVEPRRARVRAGLARRRLGAAGRRALARLPPRSAPHGTEQAAWSLLPLRRAAGGRRPGLAGHRQDPDLAVP